MVHEQLLACPAISEQLEAINTHYVHVASGQMGAD